MMAKISAFFIIFINGQFILAKICEDKRPEGNQPSECPMRKDLCDHPIYKNLMAEQCAKTCGRCGRALFGNVERGNKICRDNVGPDGISECPKYPERCKDPIWGKMMRKECPLTCGICKQNQRKPIKIFKAMTRMPPTTTQALDFVDFPMVLNSINPQFRECDDFFDYVCDGERKKMALGLLLKDNSRSFNQFAAIRSETDKKLIDLLNKTEVRQRYENNSMFAKIYEYFDACRDTKTRMNDRIVETMFNELSALRQKFNPSGGGSPSQYTLNTEFIRATFPLNNILTVYGNVRQILILFFPIFVFYPMFGTTMKGGQYAANPDVVLYELAIYSRSAGPERADYIRRLMHSIFDLNFQLASPLLFSTPFLRPNATPAEALQQWIENIMTVETEINKIWADYNATSAGTYQQLTLREIQANYLPGIDWATVLGDLDSRINGDTKVLIKCQKCFQEAQQFIDQNPGLMQSYLEYDIIYRYLYALGPQYISFLEDIPHGPMELICITRAASHFHHSFDRLYIENYFSEKKKADLMELIQRVKAEFRGMLVEDEDWLDEKTRARALLKVDKMGAYSGHLDEIGDDAFLAQQNQCYNQIDRRRMSFGEIEMLANKCTTQKLIKGTTLLGENRELLYTNYKYFQSFEANAFYNSANNRFVMLAGFSEFPFYDERMPEPMKLGGIGVTIGHEITHGFDNNGKRHNELGLLEDWWDPFTAQHYLNKEQCFIEQYRQFKVNVSESEQLPVDGEFTLGENIADQGGIKSSYRALQTYLRSNGPGERRKVVRGLEYLTDEQLFFVSYAFSWCSVEAGSQARYLLKGDTHSPNRARVNVALSNFQQFYDAFGCREGDGMYKKPEERCQLW